MSGLDIAHIQDDVNSHILRMLEDIVSLSVVHIKAALRNTEYIKERKSAFSITKICLFKYLKCYHQKMKI